MNNRILLFLFLCLYLGACSDDNNEPDNNGGRGTPPEDRTETQAWIEDTMWKEYFWYKEMPDCDKLDYSKKDPKDFFTLLLSKKDGKTKNGRHYYYSYIEEATASSRSLSQTNYTYGFEFTGVYIGDTDNIMALVQYIVKGSPADDGNNTKPKLQRGDWITEIDGELLTEHNYARLLGGEACTFTIERWDEEANKLVKFPEGIEMPAARAIEDNPVYMYDIVKSPKGKEVGYLVYNHFTDGIGENDYRYDEELRRASSFFHRDGIKEFVLDLRYNNGGLLSSAMVLSATLAPQKALGKDFYQLKYNDSKKPSSVTRELKADGTNLNLSKLYVLVSRNSASASEMVINCLRPYMDVVVIGEQTEGKNVGSVVYTSDDKKWKMHPIICEIYNADGKSDYANGITPDVKMHEAYVYKSANTVELQQVHPLGDEKERLLFAALSMIDGTHAAGSRSYATTDGPSYKKADIYSIDRKATNGVIME